MNLKVLMNFLLCGKMSKKIITDIKGRTVFDSRGYPTVEAEIIVNKKYSGIAIAPSGASKGIDEAHEKRDNKKDFFGKSVFQNISFINTIIKEALVGQNIEDQENIDNLLLKIDGTSNKSFLGANTMIAVSMATLKTAAVSNHTYLWNYINSKSNKLPIPEVQIIGGGMHAKGTIPIQDFMIIPNGAPNYFKALEWIFKVYREAGYRLIKEKKLSGIADEGGYWPNFKSIENILSFITKIIEDLGYKPFKEISLSLDIAANNFKKKNGYKISANKNKLTPQELKEKLLEWINKYPIISIEDPFAEEDIRFYKKLKKKAPSYLQIVGDDLVVTNPKKIIFANNSEAINTVLIKPNQIGTISETIKAIKTAKRLKLNTILSARSGETEDSFLSDLCVGWKIKQLKVGSFSRSERLSKWNQCLRIGEQLKNNYAMHKSLDLWNKL